MMNLILWSVFMTGSKTPGMSDKRDVINFTISDNKFERSFCDTRAM